MELALLLVIAVSGGVGFAVRNYAGSRGVARTFLAIGLFALNRQW